MDSRAVVRRFFDELWNQRKLELADELISKHCVTHQLRSGHEASSDPRGPDVLRAHVQEWLESFPDLRFEVEQMVAEGDLVTSRCVLRGTHRHAWLGIAATGRPVSIRLFVTHRIEDGKIAEDWVVVESLGLLQQLGRVAPDDELFRDTG